MRRKRPPGNKAKRQRPWRRLSVALLLALAFGALGMGEPLEDGLRVARNRLAPVPASGEIVVIKIDDASQDVVGRWPWPRSTQAALVDRISDAGAKQLLLDITMEYPQNLREDRIFADALKRSGRTVLPVHLVAGESKGRVRADRPLRQFGRYAKLGLISVRYNYESAVWDMLYGYRSGGSDFRSFASLLAGLEGPVGSTFPINYRIDLDSLPQYSAGDLLAGRVGANRLRGKSVIIGTTSEFIGDQFLIPGRARHGGVFIHALAAETLKRGRPVALGWLPALAVAGAAAAFAMRRRRAGTQAAILAASAILILVVPQFTESAQIFVGITPALFLLISVGSAIGWQRYRQRGMVNTTSGLPNINALRSGPHSRNRALIVARVLNFPQLAAAVESEGERSLVDQIVQRLTVGAQDHVIYQGDEGVFAWLTDPGTAIGHHVEALHSLFRNPARVDGNSFDLVVSFGVEIGSGRSLAQRINSALVAADEAAAEGLKWKYHDPERMKDVNWRLSLLSQLDQAIGDGQVWVAYQPQFDIASGTIRGAEALARWTHPEKGPISPQEFVGAAEQGGRIERLTLFVLDQAIETAARINGEGRRFDIAVNLSARMLTMKSLPIEVRALLARHKLAPERLTLELTETAALAGDGSDLAPLFKLRDLGVRLSIDDYGTGLSTLDYLKKVPAAEIKIDQSFIKAMGDNRGDLVMVQSTIALAHSLDRTVVAEGVESRETLDMLKTLGCDVAQGFLIGRPTSRQGLFRRIKDNRTYRAA